MAILRLLLQLVAASEYKADNEQFNFIMLSLYLFNGTGYPYSISKYLIRRYLKAVKYEW